jgi:hypothetical protein
MLGRTLVRFDVLCEAVAAYPYWTVITMSLLLIGNRISNEFRVHKQRQNRTLNRRLVPRSYNSLCTL